MIWKLLRQHISVAQLAGFFLANLCGMVIVLLVKTCKGYRCENNVGDNPSCVLNINAILGNRKMADNEIAKLLEKRSVTSRE